MIETWHGGSHLNSLTGICIKLNREQDFMIISYGKSCNLMCLYDMSGEPLKYFFEPCGDGFKNAINGYFVTQID